MTLILLTGAGFSRNWGGWLANEEFEYVLGRPEIGNGLRARLWADKLNGRGFENTLGELQHQKQKGDQSAAEMVRELMGGLVAMFDAMNQGLKATKFEWGPAGPTQADRLPMLVGQFLMLFDYIFTLNQDMLLESYYSMIYLSPRSVQRPGLKYAPRHQQKMLGPGSVVMYTPDHTNLKIDLRKQPYIKLHGSSDWVRDSGEPLLVLGGGKEVEIAQDPLLTWYQKEFSDALHRPGAKLMVIGYSFGDEHINEVIGHAADQGGLTLFIVDPEGVDVLYSNKLPPSVAPGESLRDQLSPHIRGASRRPLSSTFIHDRVELGKLMAFLNGS
jgi:hypothetical protein